MNSPPVADRRNVFYLSYKKIERSETILRDSAVRYSKFYGSLFPRLLRRLFGPDFQKHRLVVPIRLQKAIYLDGFTVKFNGRAT